MDDKPQPQSAGIKEPTRAIYPSIELPPAVDFVTKVFTELGYSHYHDKEAIAQIHNTAYHNIKQKLSSCNQYGLLELKYSVGYKITPLFFKLYRPEYEGEVREGILQALKSPPLYDRLITEYNGHNVPSENGLSTILFRRYGLHENAATKASQVFLNNLNEYKLIGSDNVLCFDIGMMDNGETQEVVDPFPVKESPTAKALPASTSSAILLQPEYIEIPIPLKNNGRAYLRIPEGATGEDFEKIAKVVAAYI